MLNYSFSNYIKNNPIPFNNEIITSQNIRHQQFQPQPSVEIKKKAKLN